MWKTPHADKLEPVEQPAIGLFSELGYDTANCFSEKVGLSGSTLGRETTEQVILTPKLRSALKKLNPDLHGEAIDLAIEELARDRSAMSLVQANREVYKLLKDDGKVAFQNAKGEESDEFWYNALFDILTKPEFDITESEKADVKTVARMLLQTLKEAKLVLDWRKRQRTRADVYTTVRKILDELPRAYTPDLYQQKCDTVYQHVYDSYQGEGKGIYSVG